MSVVAEMIELIRCAKQFHACLTAHEGMEKAETTISQLPSDVVSLELQALGDACEILLASPTNSKDSLQLMPLMAFVAGREGMAAHSMARLSSAVQTNTKYVCKECGWSSSKTFEQCPSCAYDYSPTEKKTTVVYSCGLPCAVWQSMPVASPSIASLLSLRAGAFAYTEPHGQQKQ